MNDPRSNAVYLQWKNSEHFLDDEQFHHFFERLYDFFLPLNDQTLKASLAGNIVRINRAISILREEAGIELQDKLGDLSEANLLLPEEFIGKLNNVDVTLENKRIVSEEDWVSINKRLEAAERFIAEQQKQAAG